VRNLLRLFNSVANSGVTCLEIVDSGAKLEIFSGSKLELIPDRVVFGFLSLLEYCLHEILNLADFESPFKLSLLLQFFVHLHTL